MAKVFLKNFDVETLKRPPKEKEEMEALKIGTLNFSLNFFTFEDQPFFRGAILPFVYSLRQVVYQ
jgi:hypothetical protein